MTVYRVTATGLFRFDFTKGGRRYTRKGFKSAAKARRAEDKRREEVEAGLTDPFPTFAALVNAWLESGEATKTSHHLYQVRKQLDKAFSTLGKLRPKDITRAQVEPILNRLVRDGKKASTVNSYRKVIMSALNYGLAMGAIPYNPAKGIPRVPEPEPGIDPIPTADLRKLIVGAEPDFGAKLTFIAHTGCRWAESKRLAWRSDVHTDRVPPLVLLTTRKNRGGRIRKRPQILTPSALRAVEAMRGRDPVYVFPAPEGGASAYPTDYARLKTLCKRVGVKRYGFHQLRHWAGLVATQTGKSRKAVADYLGHTSVGATDRYMHALAAEVHEVAARIETELSVETEAEGDVGRESGM